MTTYLIYMNGTNAFAPSAIANNALWLDSKDASTITAVSNIVSKWTDKSGAGNDVTASGSGEPTYSATALGGTQPGITGNGTTNKMATAGNIVTANSNFTISAVIQQTNVTGNNALFGFGSYAIQGQNSTTGRLRAFDGSELTEANQDLVAGTPYYVSIVYRNTSGAYDIYINGVLTSSLVGTAFTYTTGVFTLFNYLTSVFGAITISELLFYTRGLTVAELKKIHAYLSTRWGFAANPSYQYDVVLALGQSNMVGHFSGISKTLDNTGARNVFQVARETPNDLSYMMLCQPPQFTGNSLPVATGNISPSVNFCRDMQNIESTGRAVLLAPCAVPSTGFSTNDWNPGNTLYEAVLARVNTLMAQLPAGSTLASIIWHQGEADSAYTQLQYSTHIDAMIADMRSRMTGAATTPFICGGMLPGGNSTAASVTASLIAVPDRNANCYYSTANGLTSAGGDNVHFDIASARLMGHRYFGNFPLAANPLVYLNSNRDSSLVRAYQLLTSTVTGTSGGTTLTCTGDEHLNIFAGMTVQVAGTTAYTVQSVATVSGHTTITVVGTLSATYTAGTTIAVQRISQWSDLSGNGNHLVQAVLANQPLYNSALTSPFGLNGITCPIFDGSKSFLRNDGIDLRVVGTGGWALTMVVQKNASNRMDPVSYKNQVGSADAFGIVWDSSQHFDYFPSNPGGGTAASFTGTAAPAISTPHILTLSKNNSNGFTTYIDNVADTATTDTADYSLILPDTSLWIGANRNSSNAPQFILNGMIAEFAFWPRALTGSELLQNHKVLGSKYNIAV